MNHSFDRIGNFRLFFFSLLFEVDKIRMKIFSLADHERDWLSRE